MKTLGNIIWFIFAGLWCCIYYFLLGILLCITIIGIPFGKQCFKLASLFVFPFGTNVNSDFSAHPIMNILWCIFFGWEIAVGLIVIGLILYITIIGIPFGKQCFKLAQLAFIPFGATF